MGLLGALQVIKREPQTFPGTTGALQGILLDFKVAAWVYRGFKDIFVGLRGVLGVFRGF